MTEKFNYIDVTGKEGKMRSTRTKRKECDEFPIELTKNYSESLPISEAKKKDLLNLVKKNIIPEELEHWYKNLKTVTVPKDIEEEEMLSGEDDNL